jgi:hypothetical protein
MVSRGIVPQDGGGVCETFKGKGVASYAASYTSTILAYHDGRTRLKLELTVIELLFARRGL